MNEEWKPVRGYEGHYEVSNLGAVRSLDRYITIKSGNVRFLKGRPMKLRLKRDGYLDVGLTKNGIQTMVKVHTIVLEAFIGPCPEKMVCCHWNDIRTDNRLENLRWDTSSNNARDAIRNGTHPSVAQSKRQECSRGHLYTPASLNPTRLKIGKRSCLACERATTYAKRHGRMDEIQSIADDYYDKIISST